MLKNIDVEAVKAFMIIFMFVGSMFCLFRFSKYLKNQITFDSLFYHNLVPFVLLIVLGFVLIIILNIGNQEPQAVVPGLNPDIIDSAKSYAL